MIGPAGLPTAGKFDLESSGVSFAELMGRAEGDIQFTLRNGTLPHIELPDAARPFRCAHLLGALKRRMETGN